MTSSRVAILLSAGPVDGFPPVQHQARLFAERCFSVELITVPRLQDATEIVFSHPGVQATVLPQRPGRGLPTAVRPAEFSAALLRLRFKHRNDAIVEIAYDPLAMLISDYMPLRPSTRVAHFHESLDTFDQSWIQRRLRRAIRGYQYAVVADRNRGAHLAEQLGLAELPFVVPNYPLLLDQQFEPSSEEKNDGFEVIYAGSIGIDQKLDLVLQAMAHCPENVRLTLLGNRELPTAKVLLQRAAELGLSHRLHLPGWLDYRKVPRRLAQAHLAVSYYDPKQINTRNSVGASNKRYEYMRAGLPQIGDMNPGVPELIEGNRIGRCVTSFAPAELASLIREYADDPARCLEEGQRAWQLHRERFNYQSSFKPLLDDIERRFGSNCPFEVASASREAS